MTKLSEECDLKFVMTSSELGRQLYSDFEAKLFEFHCIFALVFNSEESSHESFIILSSYSSQQEIIPSKDYFSCWLFDKKEKKNYEFKSIESRRRRKSSLHAFMRSADIKSNICLMIFSKSVWILSKSLRWTVVLCDVLQDDSNLFYWIKVETFYDSLFPPSAYRDSLLSPKPVSHRREANNSCSMSLTGPVRQYLSWEQLFFPDNKSVTALDDR